VQSCPRLWHGQAVQVQSMGFELPIMPPHVRTTFKVIATSRRLELIGAVTNTTTNFIEQVDGLIADGAERPAQSLATLLKPSEWATAQAEIVTRPSGLTLGSGGGATATPNEP
jgi:hypothetical protein